MKKVMLFFLIIAAAGGLLAAGRLWRRGGEDRITSIRIGVSVYDQYDTFVSSLIEQLKESAIQKEDETGIEIIVDVVNAAGSQLEQNDQVGKFIQNEYDIICVNLVDRTDPTLIIDKARSADIPVIFFNRELVPEDLNRYDKAYYVGAFTVEPGIIQGNIISELYRNQKERVDKNGDGIIQYIMMEGEAGHQDAIVRTEYSVNTITDNGIKIEKLAYALANWNRDQARSKADRLIEEFGEKIEVVIANNDDMALGVIDAYRGRNLENEMPVIVGIDGTEAGLAAVKAGEMYGTAYNDRVGQGRSLLELSYSLKTGEPLPEDIPLIEDKYIRYSYIEITDANVDEFQESE